MVTILRSAGNLPGKAGEISDKERSGYRSYKTYKEIIKIKSVSELLHGRTRVVWGLESEGGSSISSNERMLPFIIYRRFPVSTAIRKQAKFELPPKSLLSEEEWCKLV